MHMVRMHLCHALVSQASPYPPHYTTAVTRRVGLVHETSHASSLTLRSLHLFSQQSVMIHLFYVVQLPKCII